MENKAAPILERDSWQFYLTARDSWEAMYRDCGSATTSIELEQYILSNDSIGQRFLELFIRKAAQGVKIFVICDKFGSIKLLRSPLIRQLRRNGAKLYFYHPIKGWNILMPWRWFPRTHIKTLLVDSSIAYVGSACMADHMANWRDTQIRIIGPSVSYVRKAFQDIEFSFLRNKKPDVTPTPPMHYPFRYVLSQPWRAEYEIYLEVYNAIKSAEHYVYIATPFFIPHNRVFRLLEQLSRRGVEIIIMVPEKSDIKLADWVCLSYSERLRNAGIRILHYKPQNLHCKTIVIDDNWATVGSANFDLISFFHNREANMIISEPAAIEELKQQFFSDMANSREVSQQDWQDLPLAKKIAAYLARSLKIFF